MLEVLELQYPLEQQALLRTLEALEQRLMLEVLEQLQTLLILM
jgi:hypothetical protein